MTPTKRWKPPDTRDRQPSLKRSKTTDTPPPDNPPPQPEQQTSPLQTDHLSQSPSPPAPLTPTSSTSSSPSQPRLTAEQKGKCKASSEDEPKATPPTHTPSPQTSPTLVTDDLQAAAENLITYPPNISIETVDRIDNIVNFADPNVPRFNIHVFPEHSNWGTPSPPGKPETAEESAFCFEEQAIVLWVVGSARYMQLEPTSTPQQSIGLRPLCPRHLQTAIHLQFELSKPPRQPYTRTQFIFANKFNKGGKPFPEAYDATTCLLPWAKMKPYKIDATTIQTNDTVLIECYIKRFRPSGTRPTPENHWPQWVSSFDLKRIAVLVRATPQLPLPKDSDFTL